MGKLRVDNVLNATIPGNHFIRGHNTMKNTLNTLLKYCGIPSEVEPYGVFADLIPQQPLNRNQAFRAAQAIRPDLRAEHPDNNGGTKTTYLEVKTVSGMSQSRQRGQSYGEEGAPAGQRGESCEEEGAGYCQGVREGGQRQ